MDTSSPTSATIRPQRRGDAVARAHERARRCDLVERGPTAAAAAPPDEFPGTAGTQRS